MENIVTIKGQNHGSHRCLNCDRKPLAIIKCSDRWNFRGWKKERAIKPFKNGPITLIYFQNDHYLYFFKQSLPPISCHLEIFPLKWFFVSRCSIATKVGEPIKSNNPMSAPLNDYIIHRTLTSASRIQLNRPSVWAQTWNLLYFAGFLSTRSL